MNLIFQISGGIGKCVMATAICEAMKKKYPNSNLIVISGYPEVFLNNKHVHRSYSFNNLSYFYEEYIEDKEIKVFAHDPYLETSHIKSEKHCIETWCDLFGLEYSGEVPQIYLTDRELNFFGNRFVSDKPIFLIQSNGGAQSDLKYSWARDIPRSVVESVIEEFRETHNIVHIKREDQLGFQFTTAVSDSFRALCVLIMMSDKRLMMDSFGQHAAFALNKPSVVCWVSNKPNVFGYPIHTNIVCNPFTVKPELRSSVFSKFNISGDLLEFPYNNENEIFNTEHIIGSLKNLNNG